jgi:hypothetical protein
MGCFGIHSKQGVCHENRGIPLNQPEKNPIYEICRSPIRFFRIAMAKNSPPSSPK